MPKHSSVGRKRLSFRLAAPFAALSLVGVGLVPIAIASSTIQVSVFSYPGLTEGNMSCSDEVDNLEEIILGIPGYTVDRTITTLADTGGTTLLQRLNASRFFFVPDMESAFNVNSTSDFPSTAVTAFQTWLNDGGVLVMTGTHGTKDIDFLNKITSWGLASATGRNGATRNDANASGTPFGDASLASTTLGVPSATESVNKNTAPGSANFKAMWGVDNQAAVATMTYGRGTIIYLGWDFFNSGLNEGTNAPCPANSDNWVQKIVPAALEYAAQLSASGLTNPTSTGGTLNYSFANNGTSYYVIVPRAATAPTAAQVKAGVDYGAVTVTRAGNSPQNANTEINFSITGLTPATDYTAYMVTEWNSPAELSAVETLEFSTAPGTPTVSSVSAGNTEVSVAIAPFGTETNFEYSIDGGSNWVARSPSAVTTPWVITGLTNGQSYSFTFRSSFRTLRSSATSASSVTPVGVPGAPTSVSGTATGSSIALSWTAPASNGGSAITGYKIEVSTDNGSTWTTVTANTGNTSTSATISQLSTGNYRYRVSALNTNGSSLASTASTAVSVTASAPGLPTNLGISHNGFGSATVSWDPPTSDGGSAVTGYVVEYEVGGTWQTLTPSGRVATVSGVWPNQGWSFRVAATNTVGTGSFAVQTHTPPPPFTGPIITKFSSNEIPAGSGTSVNLEGLRLGQITEFWIGNQKLSHTTDPSGRVTLQLPALVAGTHNLRIIYSGGAVLIHQDAFRVSRPNAGEARPLRFTSFAGDSFRLTPAARAVISDVLSGYSGIKKITCIGSTSGNRVTASDQRLAFRRAQEACNHARQFAPTAEIELRANPAAGIGPRFRGVTLQIISG
ncbi:MAG: hypothetical protein F2536_01915 [Actinobacteria bacterium]|uniref:Unannotated protein n=1 Tax=freshwater metagenome TaxID=449393 RepID=A0A6J6BXL3_9ZZZZ|nr:hypothetical protein [Actinomycetota bacterium]